MSRCETNLERLPLASLPTRLVGTHHLFELLGEYVSIHEERDARPEQGPGERDRDPSLERRVQNEQVSTARTTDSGTTAMVNEDEPGRTLSPYVNPAKVRDDANPKNGGMQARATMPVTMK